MNIVEVTPSPVLRPFVRSYHYARWQLGDASVVKPLTARPELMLQFSLGRPMVSIDHRSERAVAAPDAVLVGRQPRRNFDLVVSGDVVTFTVHFQPAGLYRLFHMPTSEITDEAADAFDVLPPDTRQLHACLVGARDLSQMIRSVEVFLLSRLDRSRPFHPVQALASMMLSGRSADAPVMAAACGLGMRQVERAFREQVGVGPKVFSRVIRFVRTVQTKIDNPALTWAAVAAGSGYYDQAHFVRECHSLGGGSPTALAENWIDCRP